MPAQALGGLLVVLTRKARREAALARDAVLGRSDSFPLIEATPAAIHEAMELVTAHRPALGRGDAGRCRAGGCLMLLSKDMQDGFPWSGVTVRNPFGRAPGCRCA